jgi:hypothetical protein
MIQATDNTTNTTNETIINITQIDLIGREVFEINCSETSYAYNVTCLEIYPICQIDRFLDSGEQYQFESGACDINFTCTESIENETYGVVEFPAVLSMNKDNTSFVIDYTVLDHLGNPYLNRSWNLHEMDAMRMDVDVGFECPAEIFSENVNFATCTKYLDRHLQTSDPLLLSMVTGTNKATEALVKCQSELNSKTELSDTWHANYNARHIEWEQCYMESNNKTDTIVTLQNKMTQLQSTTIPLNALYFVIIVVIVLSGLLLISYDIIPIGRK